MQFLGVCTFPHHAPVAGSRRGTVEPERPVEAASGRERERLATATADFQHLRMEQPNSRQCAYPACGPESRHRGC